MVKLGGMGHNLLLNYKWLNFVDRFLRLKKEQPDPYRLVNPRLVEVFGVDWLDCLIDV